MQAETHFTALSQEIIISMPELQDGDTVGGIITILPEVSASAPLVKLELLVDGTPVSLLGPREPEMAYDTSLLSPGEHTFLLEAQDISGNTGRQEITLDISPPVTVTLLSPSADAVLRGETSLAVEVSAIPEISHLEIWVDDQLIHTWEASPYETIWDSSVLDDGPHQVRVVAYDVQGHKAEAIHSVTVPTPSYLLPVLITTLVLTSVAALIFVPLRLRRKQQRHDQELSEFFARKPASLREVHGINPGHVWPLEKDEFRLGRKRDENDLPLMGLSAARQQAIIRYLEGDYVIISLYPEKPALVNEIPALPQAVLKSGDTLRLGETVLHFELQG
jgi:hypothetical protein